MDVHALWDADEAVRLCGELPGWINSHRQRDESRSYHAKELDYSFNGLPTLAVEVTSVRNRIAAYKCNITLIRDDEQPWLVFSPLVVVWEKSREERGSGHGRPIIDHSVSSFAGFCEARAHAIPNVLIATGNLTVAKAGRPFFEALGWEITNSSGFARYAGNRGLTKALKFVAAQVEAAMAQFAQNVAEPVDPLSFAMLRLTQGGDATGQPRAS